VIIFSGQSNVTAECNAGYYCLNRAVSPTPSNAAQGGICPAGTYCPKGSPTYIMCDAGTYCPNQGLHSPYANCSAGFYCWLGSKSPCPDDNTTGNACPQGGFCPVGSHNFTFCPPGTFSNATNNTELADCLDCTEGSYCMGYGNPNPTDLCNAGFYCSKGQQMPEPPNSRCPTGHFCPRGSVEGKPCPSGTYQNEQQQESCKVCC